MYPAESENPPQFTVERVRYRPPATIFAAISSCSKRAREKKFPKGGSRPSETGQPSSVHIRVTGPVSPGQPPGGCVVVRRPALSERASYKRESLEGGTSEGFWLGSAWRRTDTVSTLFVQGPALTLNIANPRSIFGCALIWYPYKHPRKQTMP